MKTLYFLIIFSQLKIMIYTDNNGHGNGSN